MHKTHKIYKNTVTNNLGQKLHICQHHCRKTTLLPTSLITIYNQQHHYHYHNHHHRQTFQLL